MVETTLFKQCTNCLKTGIEVYLVLKNEKFYACPSCTVNYAKDRSGFAFMLENEVMIRNYHTKTDNRIFIIKGIYIHEECESGRLIFLVDKETGKHLKAMLDTNWLLLHTYKK